MKHGKTAKVIVPVDVLSIDTPTFDAKSVKTGKVKHGKTAKVMSVDVFSIDTSKSTVSGDVFSYGGDSFSFATETAVASSKTEVDSKSEDDAPSNEAKSVKIAPKVVRSTDSITGSAANNIVAAESGVSAENTAVINGAGAFFVMVTLVAFGAMMA